MGRSEYFEHILVFCLAIFFYISTISAINYLTSHDVFDANVVYVNNVKTPYGVIVNIESFVGSEQKYDVEVIYRKENLVVASKSLECDGFCETKLDLNKVFFDRYDVIVTTKYEGNFYRKKLKFDLEKPISQNQLFLNDVYFISNESKNVNVRGKILLDFPSQVILETYPIKEDDLRIKKQIDCEVVCEFNLEINKTLLIDKYKFNVYLPNDVLTKEFDLKYFDNSNIDYNNLKSSSENFNFKNNSLSKNEKLAIKNLVLDEKRIKVVDLFNEVKEINVDDLNNDSQKNLYKVVKLNSSLRGDDEVKLKPKLHNVQNLGEIVSDVSKSEFDSESLNYESKKGFLRIQQNSVVAQEFNNEINPIVFEEESLEYNLGKSRIDNLSLINTSSFRKLIPGVYKKEKIVRYKDGSEEIEENFFAYGLISINTLKPLYHRNEKVEMLIVVLDRGGYLVSDADIVLNITTPLENNLIFSSQNFDIVETKDMGVYKVSFEVEEYGNYNLYAQVELEDMILDVSSYFNVVDFYDFDIIRDVPATIDPWQGPFENKFEITPLNDYRGEYSFTEVFSSDFEVIDTDADKIETIGDTIYLTWFNMRGVAEAFYVAQTPLKTPYLYYLGESYVDFNEGYSRFYENRSWLFAIDPAGKICDFTSPCICGAGCKTGDGSNIMFAGHETIDACADARKEYEWTDDIRVTNLNGSYFGVGDTVQICVDYNCDIAYNGDRASIGYKSGNVAWANTHVIFQTGTTGQASACVGIQTYCVNRVLNSYVGAHHVRGSTVYQGNANRICHMPTYYDHDDLEFQVLAKNPPSHLSWELNNGTDTGNNLNVIRGSSLFIESIWNLPLQQGDIRHNSVGSYQIYPVDFFNNNRTTYNFDTSNITLYPNLGQIRTDRMRANDLYFNLTGQSAGTLDFYIYGEVRVNQSFLVPNVGYSGINSTMSCQFTDYNLPEISYSGLTVDFFKNGVLMGTNLTNSTGWAQYSFQESVIGDYNITCSVSNQGYILSTPFASSTKELFVRDFGADINIPQITDINISSILFSIGGVTTISATVTDNILVDKVYLYVTLPNTTTLIFNMNDLGLDRYSYSFSQTTIDGNYKYYIKAIDNSSNPAFSSIRNFEVIGVRSFIGIESTQSIFKLGQSLNLTSFSKILNVDGTSYSEEGDIDNIFYSFNSGWEGWTTGGTQNEWERGFATAGYTNQCHDGRCLGTDLDNNYNANSNQWVRSPIIDFSGRNNIVVSYWRMLQVQDGTTTDRAFFEGSANGGTNWNIYFQDSLLGSGGAYTLPAGFSTYYPVELEGSSNGVFRFRLTSNGNTHYNGWAVDSVNISFNPREDWTKGWNYLTSDFGTNVNKITAIKLGFNITNYVASGSNAKGNPSPDIEVQIFNGTDYSTSFFCNLDSSISYPHYCEFGIKNIPEFLEPWEISTNRNIRFRAINMDMGDSIEWEDVKREYVTPSIVENNGIGEMTAYLLQQFRNSTGGVVSTLYFQPISLLPGEARQLSDFWTYSIAGNFQLGNYTAYVALTDALGNVLQNEDDFSFIEDSYEFEIRSLIINPVVPRWNKVVNESFVLNLTLDTTSYGAGGWCAFSLEGGANVTMNQLNLTNYVYPLFNVSDGVKNLIFYCNDSDGDVVDTGLINFNVSEVPRVSFIPPTLINNSYVNQSWTLFNTSIFDSSLRNIYYEFGDANISLIDDSNVLFMNANNQVLIGENSTDIKDISSYENHGKFFGDAQFSPNGKFAGSVLFDGNNDWVQIEDDSSLDSTTKFSFSAWIYDSAGDTQPRGIASKRVSQASSDYAWSVFKWDDNYLFFDIGSTGDRHNSGVEIPSNEWVYITVTFDGSAPASERKKYYYNGELVSVTPSAETSIPRVVGVPVTLGILNPSYGSSWNGYLDEIKIFNKVLSEEEITSHYNSNIVKYTNNSWYAQVNHTKLKNNKYEYRVCVKDVFSNLGCTEERTININKTLPKLNITNPKHNSKFSNSDVIFINVTTDVQVDKIWCDIDNSGSFFNLTNVSLFDWTYNLNLVTAYYNVTCSGSDFIGNVLENVTNFFLVLPDKLVKVEKSFKTNGLNTYEVKINVSNLGKWEEHLVFDFTNSNFNPYLVSPNYDWSSSILSSIFAGNSSFWNLTIAKNSSFNLSYNLEGMGDYSFSKNYVVGIE